MTAKQILAPEVRVLMAGLAMGESPRWHESGFRTGVLKKSLPPTSMEGAS
jgi:hypothetical protein